LLSAVFGSLHKAKLLQVEEETRHTALRNGILRSQYLPRADLESGLGHAAQGIVTIVEGSKLSREEKDDIRRQLSSIRVIIASAASRSRQGQNGDGTEEPGQKRKRKRGRPRKPVETKAA
jgi:hypothetical protein